MVMLLAALGSPAGAQERVRSWPITAGDQIRLYSATGDTLRAEGIFSAVDGERIIVTRDGRVGSFSASFEEGDLVEVLRPVPRARRIRQRSLRGAFLGGSLGGIAAPFVARSRESAAPLGGRVAIGMLAGGLLGAGAGAVLGHVLPAHRWERFRLDPWAAQVARGQLRGGP